MQDSCPGLRDAKLLVLLLLCHVSSMSNDHSMTAKSRLLVEQAIGEAMEDLAQRTEARAKREAEHNGAPRDRHARIGLAIAVPMLVALIVWNFTSVPIVAAGMVGPAISRQEAEMALRDVVTQVDAFVDDYGEVPTSLAEVGLPSSGEWQYARLSRTRYHLEMTLGRHSLAFTK